MWFSHELRHVIFFTAYLGSSSAFDNACCLLQCCVSSHLNASGTNAVPKKPARLVSSALAFNWPMFTQAVTLLQHLISSAVSISNTSSLRLLDPTVSSSLLLLTSSFSHIPSELFATQPPLLESLLAPPYRLQHGSQPRKAAAICRDNQMFQSHFQ